MSRLTGQTRENVAAMVARLARLGRNDPSIATTLGISVAQVRGIRDEYDIPAGERRWLPTEEG